MQYILNNIVLFATMMYKYNITSQNRIAHFLAQMSHETQSFTKFVENTNYTTTQRLLEVFSKYFTYQQALNYIGKPISIANRVYANRLGNGNEASGDGYKYRARGLIHLTGKANYQAYTDYSGIDIVNNPELAARLDIALDIAGWFWSTRNINASADNNDVEAVTKKVNGGTNGLADRKAKLSYYQKLDLLDLFSDENLPKKQ